MTGPLQSPIGAAPDNTGFAHHFTIVSAQVVEFF